MRCWGAALHAGLLCRAAALHGAEVAPAAWRDGDGNSPQGGKLRGGDAWGG